MFSASVVAETVGCRQAMQLGVGIKSVIYPPSVGV